ncbi:MAG TPA: fibro-slime domain-containing protein [Polyangiaceae bacterium]
MTISLGTVSTGGAVTIIPWPPSSDYTNVTDVTFGAYALGPDISDGNLPTNTGATCSGMLFGTVRDFRMGSLTDGHPDFETAPDSTRQGGVKNIVATKLGDDGKPVYADPTDPLAGTSGSTNFDQWYRDTPGVNVTFIVAMKLSSTNGVSTFSASVNNGKGLADSSYFPLDNAGSGNQGLEHNFSFTTEIHTAFVYKGGETFTFVGDDDIWVFVDKQLVIDMGGRHSQLKGAVELDALGLTIGETYSLDVFNAERHTTQSNFRMDTTLTLANCGQIDNQIIL